MLDSSVDPSFRQHQLPATRCIIVVQWPANPSCAVYTKMVIRQSVAGQLSPAASYFPKGRSMKPWLVMLKRTLFKNLSMCNKCPLYNIIKHWFTQIITITLLKNVFRRFRVEESLLKSFSKKRNLKNRCPWI